MAVHMKILEKNADLLRRKVVLHQVEAKDARFADRTDSTGSNAKFQPQTVDLEMRRTLHGHAGKLMDLQWNKNRHLVTAAHDGKMIVWNGTTAQKVALCRLSTSFPLSCTFSPVGRLVAGGGLDNACTVFNVEAPRAEGCLETRAVTRLSGHTDYVGVCRFLNDAELMVGSGDCTCSVWDVEYGAMVARFSGHKRPVHAAAVNPHRGDTWLTGSDDGSVRLWDKRKEFCAQSFHGHVGGVNAVEYFPTGNAFGSGCEDRTCRLFDIRADQVVNKYRAFGQDKVQSISFSRSGRLLFVGYNTPYFGVYDVARTEFVCRKRCHEDSVRCIKVSPCGLALATGSFDTTAIIWA